MYGFQGSPAAVLCCPAGLSPALCLPVPGPSCGSAFASPSSQSLAFGFSLPGPMAIQLSGFAFRIPFPPALRLTLMRSTPSHASNIHLPALPPGANSTRLTCVSRTLSAFLFKPSSKALALQLFTLRQNPFRPQRSTGNTASCGALATERRLSYAIPGGLSTPESREL